MTQDEIANMLGRLPSKSSNSKVVELPTQNISESVDWRTKGALNPVQNQGACGSCWAFSSVAAMESAHFIKTGKLLKLSEQQLVDCDPQSSGCNGGLETWAFDYAKTNGLELESDYPYRGVTGRSCQATTSKELVEATSYTEVPKRSVTQLKAAIDQQPTCISIHAGAILQFYFRGIINSKLCRKGPLDHAVTAVGYGSENGKDYFIVRNSWGSGWGEHGYFRIATESDGDEGVCGILMDSSRPSTN